MSVSPNRVIEPFSMWKDTLEEIKGIARQFSHLTGLSTYLKDALFIEDGIMVASYHIKPKPLKWKEVAGWNLVSIKIKSDGTIMAFIEDETPIEFGPQKGWIPVRKSMELMERVRERLKKVKTNEG
jgi:hypothetical protein